MSWPCGKHSRTAGRTDPAGPDGVANERKEAERNGTFRNSSPARLSIARSGGPPDFMTRAIAKTTATICAPSTAKRFVVSGPHYDGFSHGRRRWKHATQSAILPHTGPCMLVQSSKGAWDDFEKDHYQFLRCFGSWWDCFCGRVSIGGDSASFPSYMGMVAEYDPVAYRAHYGDRMRPARALVVPRLRSLKAPDPGRRNMCLQRC
jgi:hypothetical protein